MSLQPVLTETQKQEITAYVNMYRAKNQAPPLIWDDAVAAFSQQWSYHLITNNVFQHSGTQDYGENLAFFQGYGTNPMTLFKKAVDMWYNEIVSYDFNKPGFSAATGHFTCLVWKASTKFGMGISINPTTSVADITFNTAPPGNVLSRFQENVLPTTGTPSPAPAPAPSPAPTPPPPSVQITKAGIIAALNNIIYGIQTNQPKQTLITNIYSVIRMVNKL